MRLRQRRLFLLILFTLTALVLQAHLAHAGETPSEISKYSQLYVEGHAKQEEVKHLIELFFAKFIETADFTPEPEVLFPESVFIDDAASAGFIKIQVEALEKIRQEFQRNNLGIIRAIRDVKSQTHTSDQQIWGPRFFNHLTQIGFNHPTDCSDDL
jgi:hypothetical protein